MKMAYVTAFDNYLKTDMVAINILKLYNHQSELYFNKYHILNKCTTSCSKNCLDMCKLKSKTLNTDLYF